MENKFVNTNEDVLDNTADVMENDTVEECHDTTGEIERIISKYDESIASIELSDEERIERMDNFDTKGVGEEINQSENGVYIASNPATSNYDPNPNVENEVPATDTVYEENPKPVITKTVSVDNMTNEEIYGKPEYGEKAEDGISGDINESEEEIEAEDTRVLGTDEECDEEEEEMRVNDYVSREDENEEIEIPEEIKEDAEEVAEEEVIEDVDTNDEEVVEDIEEYDDEDEEEEIEDEEEATEVVEEIAGEDTEPEEAVTDEVEVGEIYSGHVNEELDGELRKEVEAIELTNNEGNTELFDKMSFVKDPDYEMKDESKTDLEEAEDMADLVNDGVGVQETYDGEPVEATGGEEIPEGVDAYIPTDEAETVEGDIKDEVATESLHENNYQSRCFSARNVLSKFWK